MKDNKKVYSQPQTTLLYMENQEMICSSVQPNQIQVVLSKQIMVTITAVSIMVVEKETIYNYEL